MKKKIKEDLIPGGKGDSLSVKNVDPNELKMGIKVELEHTNDSNKAREIALDHLSEDPKYYSKLEKAGLADELKESLRKQIKIVLKEYYRDSKEEKFTDAIIDLLHTAKDALSVDMEQKSKLYYNKRFRTAGEITQTIITITNLIKKIKNWK